MWDGLTKVDGTLQGESIVGGIANVVVKPSKKEPLKNLWTQIG
jgi:hypothetical protein